MTSAAEFDYSVVGGGLQGCLLAHALAWHRPEATVLLVERADELCGNHTWSFHETDVAEQARSWFDPLVTHRWPGYRVRFSTLSRRVNISYATITSDRLREATLSLAGGAGGPGRAGRLVVRTGESCEILSPTAVRLGGTTDVSCRAVLDCRGRAEAGSPGGAGYQTFIGHEYETAQRWPASEPTVMDVPADQAAGFEFLYELPLGPDRVLLEYTRFHEEPACDESRAVSLIAARLAEADAGSAKLIRSERGCLPMPELVARACPDRVAAEIASAAAEDRLRRGFTRFLNRLLFCLVRPEDRWKIFQRFYRVLPEERISRFYAHRFTFTDAARIMIGWPPMGLAPIRFARSFVSLPGPLPT
ncbi:MAG: lycopene cyclase family protein [Planctomycetia bacterium]|nr:lycopene cyclase family protein [Planctomycetia bacterium]